MRLIPGNVLMYDLLIIYLSYQLNNITKKIKYQL